MNAELDAPEPPKAVWQVMDERDAEYQRLLILLFGPRAPKLAEPGNG